MYKLFDKRIKLYVTKLLQLSNINMLSIINSNKRKYILCDFIRIKTRSISFASVRFNTIISIYRLSITFRYYQYLYYIFFFFLIILPIITSLLHPFCFFFFYFLSHLFIFFLVQFISFIFVHRCYTIYFTLSFIHRYTVSYEIRANS